MKKVILIAFFFIGLSVSQAQELKPELKPELKWYTDVNEAIKVSNKKKKPLMLFFTGSDWCGWCIRLQSEVLKTPEFSKWANESVVLVELDFPRRTAQSEAIKAQNNQLQQMFGVQGYPTVCFAKAKLDKEKNVNFEFLGNTGYVAGGPAAWIASAEPFVKKPAKNKSKTKKA
nr:thioredoxin family protein [uncultured Flavobacterium sp.]